MGGSSSSKTSRTYNTTNVSQQSEGANVYGKGNHVTVQRADALALENMARELSDSVDDVTDAGVKQVEAALNANTSVTDRALDTVDSVSNKALQFSENASRDAMEFVSNFTEREQIGNDGNATRALVYVAGVAGLALVGVAWASKGGMRA